MSEGFLSRWSRLKRSGGPTSPSDASAPAGSDGVAPAGDAAATPGAQRGIWSTPALPAGPQDATEAALGEARPVVTAPADPGGMSPEAAPDPLPPIESLDFDADFKPFMQADVAPATRNAALRKLFADPSFNVMDGLDVYIDDYSLPDPIPDEMLRGLVQSQTLGLFREEAKELLLGDEPVAGSATPSAPALALDPGASGTLSEVASPASAAVPEEPVEGAAPMNSPGPRVAAPTAPPAPAPESAK